MVNISSTNLTDIQTRVLSKGLSYCPAIKTDWFQLELDLQQFFRKLKLRVWFGLMGKHLHR